VPANRKWYRDLVISHTLIDTLEGLDLRYPEPAEDLSGIVIDCGHRGAEPAAAEAPRVQAGVRVRLLRPSKARCRRAVRPVREEGRCGFTDWLVRR
jgi:hypothetical protein